MSNNEIKRFKAEELEPRDIIWGDAYAAAAILENLTLDISEEEVEKLMNDGFKAGLNAFKTMVAKSGDASKEIDKFIGSLFGITGDEWHNMKMGEAFKALKKLTEKEDLVDFFGVVKGLMS